MTEGVRGSDTHPVVAPGWYPDPVYPSQARFWDGSSWGPARAVSMHHTVPAQPPRKDPALALILTFFFGPLGMLYSTVPGAIVMFFANVVFGLLTAGLFLFVGWPVQMIWAYAAAKARS